MARPIKQGLDYFPLDVDFFEDEVIDGISGEFGIKGELITIKLLSTVYKKGYFAVWNDLLQAQIAKKSNASKDLVIQVVDRLVAWGFFNKSLFNSAKVLTSAKIQEIYFEAIKRRKTPKPTLYLVNADINDDSNEVNVNINTQSKVKESKLNKIKVNAAVTNTSSNNRDSSLNETKKPHQQLFDFYTENFPSTSTFVIQSIEYDANDYGDELVLYAMQKAVLKNVSNYKYVQGILNGWDKDGIKTVAQAKQQETQFKAKTAVKGNNDDDPRNKGLAPDDPNYRPGCSGYTNAELKARHERLGW
ncbi:DUF4373 domain-containing protein [Pediococcus pentosaceus]|uniref:DUF4373 domain-containing protein n=1 Tax=Pediococcus pentosaceus TaxID=1255 RepID=A0AA40X9F6_PEDPE|nr:Lin1244/Lin1753 domain-containing protein [Pediococcus pentosaceus]MBF7127259.1 DUF4373 domain-containing protein [Pediococcus pentosaceus]MCQ9315762.1 DUF4373 domain-containing protein [Pediococcus pentosaceus]MCQ9339483.1 DUF4373 domain-containing protein [Pediococcus pentosaceus]